MGRFTWVNGHVYAGEWVNNERTGMDIYTWVNGDVYKGEWVNDKLHGRGTFARDNGDVYRQQYDFGELVSSNRIPRHCPRPHLQL